MKKRKNNKNNIISKDLFQKIDDVLEPQMNKIFWGLFVLSILFTFLLFNLQVSVGGDDAQYIIRAYDFIHDFKYPSYQGPLYPMILSIFVGIFGIKLFILKLVSAIFMSTHLYLFFKVFRKHISSLVMLGVLMVLSINSNLLFYGGQTYSEAMFLFVQILFFMFFFKNFITATNNKNTTKQELIRYFLLGTIILTLGLVRSIGFASLFAVIAYFTIEKRWKSLIYSISGFLVSLGIWKLIKALLWHKGDVQFSSQASSLLQKHPYDASKGQETIVGFIKRFFNNSDIYLSKEFLYMMDFRELTKVENGQLSVMDTVTFFTVIVYAVLISAFVISLKRNKQIMFTSLYLAMIMGISFIMLQTIWESTRLMIVYFPLLILLLLSGIYYLLKIKKLQILQFILPLLVISVFFTILKSTINKTKDNQKIFQRHLRGNITAGMTPDWSNYVKMCQWAAKNVDKSTEIACRKPGIAFIYTGRRFKGIYKVPTQNPDTLLNNLYKQNISYVVMASLRKYERARTKYTINTIKRYLFYINKKYPNVLLLKKEIGTEEVANLWEIRKNGK